MIDSDTNISAHVDDRESPESPSAKVPMISLENVGLSFHKRVPLLDLILQSERAKKARFRALNKLNLRVYEDDVLGVIGRNGSGKSTLSMVCSQVYKPDYGTVNIQGKVQLLALGVGFQNQMTGRENIYISGSLLGMSRPYLDEHMSDIEKFADIGTFIDEPVKMYSSGMRSRLAFAIATAIRPDILILDEVLATGDQSFRDKATARMQNVREIAKCVVIISHSPGQLKKLCNRVAWVEQGRVVLEGEPIEVLDAYSNFCKDPEGWKSQQPELFDCEEIRLTP